MPRNAASSGVRASRRTRRRLENSGIPLPPEPDFEAPMLPRDITSLDDQALMELFVELTQHAEYLAVTLAEAVIDERAAEEDKTAAEARGAVQHSGEKTVAAAKARTASTPDVQEAAARLSDAYAYRKLLEPIAQRMDTRAAVCSRELSRRQARSDREGRSNRWHA